MVFTPIGAETRLEGLVPRCEGQGVSGYLATAGDVTVKKERTRFNVAT